MSLIDTVKKICKFVAILRAYLESDTGNKFISSIQHITTIIAIVVAGIWFFQKSEHVERFNITNIVTQQNLNHKFNLLRVEVSIENTGKIPVTIDLGTVKLKQVVPIVGKLDEVIENITKLYDIDSLFDNSNTINWPIIAKRDIRDLFNIKPSEIEVLSFEFIIPSDIELVQVSSEIYQLNQNLEWKRQTYHKIEVGE